MISLLVEHGADPYPVFQGTSPICKAAECGYEAEWIIPTKARNAKIQCQQRQEALRTASASGQTEVFSLLLEAGVDIDANSERNRTPLRLAVEEGEVSTARLVLKLGAREDIPDSSGGKPNVQDALGNTPLCLSAALGHEEMLESLLEMGAERNVSNNLKDTTLILALGHGHRSTFELLQQLVVER